MHAVSVCVVLALRSFVACVLSPMDYIGRGVHTQLEEVKSLQVITHQSLRGPGSAPWDT